MKMKPRKAMKLAIDEARKCEWPEEELNRKPKVGAVITIGDELIAFAHREDEHHAEKLALAKVPASRDLTQATVWTTLEPCTHTVRSTEKGSCTDLLIARKVKRVVIGILDPNQGVCGKGILALRLAGIDVRLFPQDLADLVTGLNERFIRAQQSLGITITSPLDGDSYSVGKLTIQGTYVNPPKQDVWALTHVTEEDSRGLGGGWWPQEEVRPVAGSENQWEATVQFGAAQRVKICIVRANDLGKEMIKYYEKLKDVRNHVVDVVTNIYCPDREHVRWIVAPIYWALPVSSVKKGLDVEASVEIEITEDGDPNGWSKKTVASGRSSEEPL
jgi:pyrimidine deaminase RibD-like protein